MTIINHIHEIHRFYGDPMGVRLARKHIKWYLGHWHTTAPEAYRQTISRTENPIEQIQLLQDFLHSSLFTIRAA